MLKTLKQFNLKNQTVILRAAYDITLKQKKQKWTVPNNARIKATLKTIKFLLKQNCSLIILTWLGRPDPKKPEKKFKLDPIAQELSKLIKKPVKKLNQTVGKQVEQKISNLKPGEIVLLENTRFNPGEKQADAKLSKKMAQLGNFVVFDAFAQAHRVHASTTGLLKNHQKSCCCGFLMEKELTSFNRIIKSPTKPFIIILGGAKVSDKSGLIENLLDKADQILLGGALANPFIKIKNYQIGSSKIESRQVDQGKGIIFEPEKIAKKLLKKSKKIKLPLDVVIAEKNNQKFNQKTIQIKELGSDKNICQENQAILDIGPKTIKAYGQILSKAKTIFWNGPMGVFEIPTFAFGTKAIAQKIAKSSAFSVLAGGDTESAIKQFNLTEFNHVSTGGGASLNLLAGKKLPVLKYLKQ